MSRAATAKRARRGVWGRRVSKRSNTTRLSGWPFLFPAMTGGAKNNAQIADVEWMRGHKGKGKGGGGGRAGKKHFLRF